MPMDASDDEHLYRVSESCNTYNSINMQTLVISLWNEKGRSDAGVWQTLLRHGPFDIRGGGGELGYFGKKISLLWFWLKKFRELWFPARQQIWPWRRSKVTVKVTTWYHRKGLVTRNIHAKYQSSICNSAKVMAKVKVFVTDGQTDRQTEGRTDEWDLMSPRFRESGGQKINLLNGTV